MTSTLPMFAIKDNTDLKYLSLSSGVFPEPLKVAHVVPIFKSGDCYISSNYRPISVLPIFSKLFEKVVYNRLIRYIDKYCILNGSQYDFRANHSTSMALLQLYNKISSAIDAKEYTIGIFLDLSKAFDTINHNILLDKLQHYGIRGTALDWFKSYLINQQTTICSI